jgi:multidrug efflux pump subunit AcrA (membrane-fusion protein)
VLAFEEVPNEKFLGSLEQTYSCEAGFLQGPDYCAVVDFHNRKGLAKPGMTGTVAIQLGRARNVLAVPADAVYRSGDRAAVKVRVGGRWRTRVVETGLTNGRFTQIRSGLAEGDIVQVTR